jgi:hypothetical protein
MLNFLRFDEVEFFIFAEALVTKLEQNDPSVQNEVSKLRLWSIFLAAQ